MKKSAGGFNFNAGFNLKQKYIAAIEDDDGESDQESGDEDLIS